jgi:integrase
MLLRWHQIKNGHVYFKKTKTDNPRQVPMDEDLKQLLDRLRSKSKHNVYSITGNPIKPVKNKSDYVFLHKGKPLMPHGIQALFKSACKRADIPYGLKTPAGVTIHSLRHTFGSWLAIKGISIRAIQILMGHKSLAMTMRYAHLSEDVLQESVKVLNGLTSTCHKSVTNGKEVSDTTTQTIENTSIL